MKPTLLVNLYAGPGAGKSTLAALVFASLKQAQVNCELVTEFAKDLTWESGMDERHSKLTFQPAVIGEQMWRMERLRGQVDAIITDSPVLLSMVYDVVMPDEWYNWLRRYNDMWESLNVRVVRGDRFYNPAGRVQTRKQAVTIDGHIDSLLLAETDTPPLEAEAGLDGAAAVCDRVLVELTRLRGNHDRAQAAVARLNGRTDTANPADYGLGAHA